MQIIGMTQTNFNIFNDTHQKLTVNTVQRAQPTLGMESKIIIHGGER